MGVAERERVGHSPRTRRALGVTLERVRLPGHEACMIMTRDSNKTNMVCDSLRVLPCVILLMCLWMLANLREYIRTYKSA